jgi:hypothetical protein
MTRGSFSLPAMMCELPVDYLAPYCWVDIF